MPQPSSDDRLGTMMKKVNVKLCLQQDSAAANATTITALDNASAITSFCINTRTRNVTLSPQLPSTPDPRLYPPPLAFSIKAAAPTTQPRLQPESVSITTTLRPQHSKVVTATHCYR